MHGHLRLLAACGLLFLWPRPALADRVALSTGWRLQSSAKVALTGRALSRPGADTAGWIRTSVPSTVVAAQLAGRSDADLFKGTRFRALPGMDYPIGGQFSNLSMAPTSLYARPWWYRLE